MTVKQLKERLEKCPDDAVVFCVDIHGVQQVANQFKICFDDLDGTVDVIIDWLE